MTRRVGPVVIIDSEKPQPCDVCGTVAELRPYGPNGERVCFECGMKDEEAARRAWRMLCVPGGCGGGRDG